MQAVLHRARPPRLRRRRATLPLPTGRTRSECRPALLPRVSQGPPRPWMAPVQVAFQWARPPLLRRRSRYSAGPPTADRPTQQPEQRRTGPANLFTAAPNPRGGATFPRLSGATSGYATADAAVIATRSPGGAAALPICCRSTTCCQSPRAVARSRPTWLCAALLTTECATATDRLSRRRCRGSASSALPARHATALADCLQVAGGDYPSLPSTWRATRVLRCGRPEQGTRRRRTIHPAADRARRHPAFDPPVESGTRPARVHLAPRPRKGNPAAAGLVIPPIR